MSYILPDDPSIPTYAYTLDQEISYGPKFVASIVLIKEVPSLDPTRSLDSQIQITNLLGPAASESGSAGVSPDVALRSYIHHAFVPYFNAYVSAKGISAETIERYELKKKITELDSALINLQHNIEIPGIVLNINPVIQAAIDKVRKQENHV